MAGRIYIAQATEFDPTAGLAYLSALSVSGQSFILKEWWITFATTTSASVEVLLQKITSFNAGTYTQDPVTARPIDTDQTAFGGTIKAQNTATAPTSASTLTERHHVNVLVGKHRKYADWNDDNGIWCRGDGAEGFSINCVDDPAVNVLVGCVIKEYG